MCSNCCQHRRGWTLSSSVVYTAEWRTLVSTQELRNTALLARELRTHDARRDASVESGGAFAGWGLGA